MDIVERLRDYIKCAWPVFYQGHIVWKAADEIERLREALQNVLSAQPIKGDEGSTDMIASAKALLEIDSIARAALEGKE